MTIDLNCDEIRGGANDGKKWFLDECELKPRYLHLSCDYDDSNLLE